MHRTRILCLCSAGAKRSNYLAFLLKGLGYDSLAAGVDMNSPETVEFLCNWADVVVVVQPELLSKLPAVGWGKLDPATIGPDVWVDTTPPELIQLSRDAAQGIFVRHPTSVA
jgi:hypothetical protein